MKYKMLIVDDEIGIINLLKDYFEMSDYEVFTAMSGTECLEKVKIGPDIILLDVNMPDIDGFEVCRRIRSHVSCPILFLTAKIEEQDCVNGLMLGGDDYILKPFSMEELDARVTAHLRREMRRSAGSSVKICGDLAIRYDERMAYYQEHPINLTKTEFDILELLLTHAGQVFDRERIYESVWGLDASGDSGVVKEHIRKIRQKLQSVAGEDYIETVWGVGYRWKQ